MQMYYHTKTLLIDIIKSIILYDVDTFDNVSVVNDEKRYCSDTHKNFLSKKDLYMLTLN